MEVKGMEITDSSQEKNMRLNIKQGAKGTFTGEFTVRADSIEELKARTDEMRDHMLSELKKLNGG
jgi:hypothetical protein